MKATTFSIIISVLILLFIIDLIRRQKMTFKYSLFWLSSAILVLCLAYNNTLLHRLSVWAGFTLTSNFVFFLALVFFIVLSLLLSVYANEQNNRTETLAQSIGILEFQIKELEEKLSRRNESRPDSSQAS